MAQKARDVLVAVLVLALVLVALGIAGTSDAHEEATYQAVMARQAQQCETR